METTSSKHGEARVGVPANKLEEKEPWFQANSLFNLARNSTLLLARRELTRLVVPVVVEEAEAPSYTMSPMT